MTGFIFLDKSEGMTSFTAAAKVRRLLGVKKAGHTGTLDPMATGVLVVAVGNATRFIELVDDHNKGYTAKFKLGIKTDTLDITGQVQCQRQVTAKRQDVENILQKFKGDIMQTPPMYSAIKKDGVRLYDLARQGVEIDREQRRVKIHHLELISADEDENEYEIGVLCSKGTYIRTLIDDIGEALGCGAVMTSLRRICAHGVDIEECVTLAKLEEKKNQGKLQYYVRPVECLLRYAKITVTAAQAKRFSNGGALDLERIGGKKDVGFYRVYSPDGSFLGVGEIDEDKKELSVKRVFVGE